METPHQNKAALDRMMQAISIIVILVVLSSAWSGLRSSEQSTPRRSAPGVTQASPTPTGGQETRGTPASWQATQTQSAQATAATDGRIAQLRAAGQVEPLAGSWPTWVLKSGSEIYVAPPRNAQATTAELDLLRDLASKRDATVRAAIQYWDTGSPSYRWVQLALRQLQTQLPSIPRANQALAMLNVAVYETTVTVWQAKYTYNRPRPGELAPDLPAIATPASPSYPDEHAAAAGAASAILSFLYPEQADQFTAAATEAAQSRVMAGVAFPSDVEAGLSLGQTIAKRVIAYTGLSGTRFDGPAIAAWWKAAASAEPLSPPWRPWTLGYAGDFLPAAAAPATQEATNEVLLKLQQSLAISGDSARTTAGYWTSFAGTHTYWYDLAAEKMAQYHMDENPPLAARVYALMSVAHDDSSNVCWHAMYTYRVLRPSISTDDAPRLIPPTPYSYPSAQACLASSMSTVLAAVFPLDARTIQSTAEEAAQAGLWVDGTLPSDVHAAAELGRLVALHVLSHPLSWLWGGK